MIDWSKAPEWANIVAAGQMGEVYLSGNQQGESVRMQYVGAPDLPDGWSTKSHNWHNVEVVSVRPVEGFIFETVESSNKYQRKIKGVSMDVYDIIKAYEVKCPALQHLIKKALCTGIRGHKDATQDLQDIVDSSIRALELYRNE